jgi:hypothetical protein
MGAREQGMVKSFVCWSHSLYMLRRKKEGIRSVPTLRTWRSGSSQMSVLWVMRSYGLDRVIYAAV